MADTFSPETAVYTPPEASIYALAAIRAGQESTQRGIPLPLGEGMSEYFSPLMPGQVTVILAQTSNYKSGFAHWWERETATYLIDNDRGDEAIIHISVEECVEEQVFLELGNEVGIEAGRLARGDIQNWSQLEMAATKIGTIPIYRIGDSLARSEDMPNLYLSNIVRSLQSLTTGKVTGNKITPALIVIDYLQALPIDPEIKQASHEAQRRLQVRQDFYRARQMSAYFSAPVIMLAQAKQHLDGAKGEWMMPGVYDGEESASIGQRADRMIGLWMPARTSTVGAVVSNGERSFIVRENMLMVKVLKQRGGLPAGKTWPCEIDFSRNIITAKGK